MLRISIVCPDIDVTTSPGLLAAPPGMFSVAGMTATTLSGNFISATAFIVPSTLAAPDMSNFISSISRPGFNEMPPLSKVMPLPTRAIGRSADLPPEYLRMMNFGG